MSTLKEIYEAHNRHVREEMDSYSKELKNHIKELGFDKRVIRIADGREGELKVVRESTYVEIKFYPIAKSGELSKNASGYILLGFEKLEDKYRQKESE